jgi:hypothetical protein
MELSKRPLRIALLRHGESNPGNAETRVLLRQPDFQYKLDRPFEQWCEYEPTEKERSGWL